MGQQTIYSNTVEDTINKNLKKVCKNAEKYSLKKRFMLGEETDPIIVEEDLIIKEMLATGNECLINCIHKKC